MKFKPLKPIQSIKEFKNSNTDEKLYITTEKLMMHTYYILTILVTVLCIFSFLYGYYFGKNKYYTPRQHEQVRIIG